MRPFLLAVLMLFVSGVILAPWEKKLLKEEQRFSLKKEMFSQLTQAELISLLGGLRIPLAAWLWLKVEACWENKEWDAMASLIERILMLQPHDILYYNMAAWQMAWNASSATQDEQRARLYIERGRAILEKGIENNPDSSLLYEYLGVLLRDRLHDHEAAAAAFAHGAMLPGAHSYLRRFAAYEWAASPHHRKKE